MEKAKSLFPEDTRVAQQKTQDGFRNFAARLGVAPPGEGMIARGGNLNSQGHYEPNLMTRNRIQLEYAYRGSWIIGKSIDIPAEDMTRAGIDIVTNKGAEKIQELKVQMSRLKIWYSLCKLLKWGKLYGGACGVLQISGQDPATPLDLETVGEDSFKGIVVYDRWQLYPVLSEVIDSGPDMGLPKYYDIVLGMNLNDPGHDFSGEQKTATGRVRVHHSRCIRAIGHELPFYQAITEMMWGESVVERMWDRLIEYDDLVAATGGLVNRAQLRTVGIDGFREVLAVGGPAQEALISQFEYMRQFQSNEGITLLDKLDMFASNSYSFGGLSDVWREFKQEMGGGFDIPLVRLFGQTPGGLNATGDSDLRLYYDGINSKQEFDLRNPVEMILKCMWRSMYGKSVPKDLVFTFTPLWQLSAKEKADLAKATVDTVVEAHQEGGLSTATMMKEFKQLAHSTGVFTHMTEEEIEDAENEEPPAMGELPGVSEKKESKEIGKKDSEAKPKSPTAKVAAVSKDSAWKRIKRWITRDKREEVVTPVISAKPIRKKANVTDAKKIRDWLAKQK